MVSTSGGGVLWVECNAQKLYFIFIRYIIVFVFELIMY